MHTQTAANKTEPFEHVEVEQMPQYDEVVIDRELQLLIHKQPELSETLEDGDFPVRDSWISLQNRYDNDPPEKTEDQRSRELAYFIRERQNDQRCKTSIAACDLHSPIWPQIDGYCDLFCVKCLVEAVGMSCRNYTEKNIFSYGDDLCENISDLCFQNREAVILFCWQYLYHRYGDISLKHEMPRKSGYYKLVDTIALTN